MENSLYLVVLLLWSLHSVALHRALSRSQPAAALFGACMSIIGLVVLAAGALPHIATAPIAELYHASGATLQEQTGLIAVWEATYGMLDALLVTGLVILPFGMLAHGTAMVGAPGFGARLGGLAVCYSLHMRMHIVLDDDLIAELDRRAGRGRRSAFIAELIRRGLADERRWEDIEAALSSIAVEGHDWDHDPAAWVQEQRHGDPRRTG